eukprot:scaffold8211_cov117-Cylindrotheca_fusiformis.AAC.4
MTGCRQNTKARSSNEVGTVREFVTGTGKCLPIDKIRPCSEVNHTWRRDKTGAERYGETS